MDIERTEVEKYGKNYSEDGLWNKISGNLKIYAGSEHPHAAQKPIVLEKEAK